MKFFNIYSLLRSPADGEGNDLGGGEEPKLDDSKITTEDPDAKAILDSLVGDDDGEPSDDDGDFKLPSDEDPVDGEPNDGNDGEGEKLLAGKYKSREDLLKGVNNIGNELPDYVIEGMSDEALEKHYSELSKNFNSNNKDRKYAEKKTEEPKEGDDKKGDIKQVWEDVANEFRAKGFVSNELYDKLEEAGIPSNVIDSYVDNIHNEQVQFTKEVYDLAGGEEQYNTIKSWAESNYSQEQLDAIVRLDKKSMMIALEGIKSAYEKANPETPKTPDRLRGKPPSSNGSAYKSQDEYLKDVTDPRYGKDKLYTKAVEKKLSRSKLQG